MKLLALATAAAYVLALIAVCEADHRWWIRLLNLVTVGLCGAQATLILWRLS